MTLMSGLGVLLSLVFGCLLLALVAELYYLLWWKKQRICKNTHNNNKNNFLYLYCCDNLSSIITKQNSNTNPESNRTEGDDDVELGLGKDLLLKALGEDGVESEIMRLYNLSGPPRFLFTINEETKEDLESDDGKSRVDDLTPMASPPLKVSVNPLFESSVEAELNRLRSSPPPTFQFLRNAEDKLYRRLLLEARVKRFQVPVPESEPV